MNTKTSPVFALLDSLEKSVKSHAVAARRAAIAAAREERETFNREYRTGDITVSPLAKAAVAARRAVGDKSSADASRAMREAARDMGVSVDAMANELDSLRTVKADAVPVPVPGDWKTEFGYVAPAVPSIEAIGNYATAKAKLAAMRASDAYRAGHAVLSALPLMSDAVVISTADGQVQVRRVENVPSVETAKARIDKLELSAGKLDVELSDAETQSAYADACGLASMRTAAGKRYVKATANMTKWEDKMSAARDMFALAKVAISGRAIGAIVATVGVNVASGDMWEYFVSGPYAEKLDAVADALDARRDVMPLGMRDQLRVHPNRVPSDPTFNKAMASIDGAAKAAANDARRRALAAQIAARGEADKAARDKARADAKVARRRAARAAKREWEKITQ